MENFTELKRKAIRKAFPRLNDMQFAAVTRVEGPVLVLAGAGSGKTTVLVNRIENMIKYGNAYESENDEGKTPFDLFEIKNYLDGKSGEPISAIAENPVKPWNILAITFTNKAANELKERIIKKIGEEGKFVNAGTFHSICAKILRFDGDKIGFSSHFTIYDTDDQKKLMKEVYKELNIEEKILPIKSTLSEISHAKDSLISPDEYFDSVGDDMWKKLIGKAYIKYAEKLKSADAMDFDDLIVNVVRLFESSPETLNKYQNKFKYIMVDEYQDTNHAQYVFVSMLAEKYGNLCVVGDDDQSIYRFRGATIRNILEFEDEFANSAVIRLEENYRSTQVILDAANAVISNNKGRKGKNLWTRHDSGEDISVHTAQNENDEAKYVLEKIEENSKNGDALSENAILYRKNSLSRSFENLFARSGIPYKVIGGFKFYERKEIRDILAYLQLINNKNDNIRLLRIINEPKRGIGDTTMNHASEIASALGMSVFEVIGNAGDYPALSRAASKLSEFVNLINTLAEKVETESVSAICERVVKDTGYELSLLAQGDEGQERLENVRELINNIKEYENENEQPTLSGFLEEVSLISDIDKYDESADSVVMMTVHSAKGLEFKNVYLVGFEEGVFPGNQAIFEGPEEIEEERRLCYVAITRAKRRLYITKCYSRMNFGQTERNLESRFLKEIPKELCKVTSNTYTSGFGGSGSGFSFGGGYNYERYDNGYDSHNDSYSFNQVRRPQGTMNSFRAAAPKNKETPKVTYQVGERVRHKIFGDGVIVSAEPMSNDTLLKISFETVGDKKIMANFAKLEKIL